MSRANASFAEPRDRDDAPSLDLAPPPALTLPPGAELLLETLNGALIDGTKAFAALQAAKSNGDITAIRAAAVNLVKVLRTDPLALARKVNLMVQP